MSARPLAVGDRLHGFCGGLFGRDSFGCRTVEARGADWVVIREDDGTPDAALSLESLEALEAYREPIHETRYTVACDCVRRQAP